MKKLGLVGGMGPESTIPYYHDIVYGVQKAVGKQFFPNLTIESVNVFHLLELFTEGKYDEVVDYLMSAINALVNAGAEFAALSANTAHIVFDRLAKLSPIPLLNIVEVTKDEAVRRNYRKVGLLGTIFTMREDFFKTPFIEAGIEVVIPTPSEMEFISNKIYQELELGIINPETLEQFKAIITRMKEQEGIDAIILGCTELPLLLNDEVSPVPCLDTMKIHVNAIVNTILS